MSYSCNAKGNELNLWLHNSWISSCCKATPSRLDNVDNIFSDPNILAEKAALDAGIQHPSCEYCWQRERKGLESLRQRKSAARRIEITFDNTCNFTCLYCSPYASSSWQSLVKNTDSSFLKKNTTQSNGSMFSEEALDKIIQQLNGEQLDSINFVGGEPLLSKNFGRFLDSYQFDQCESYHVTTNLCPHDNGMLAKFLYKTRNKKVQFSISLDTGLDAAEMIRVGFDKSRFMPNLNMLQQRENVNIMVLNTVSCLSLFDSAGFTRWYQDNVLDGRTQILPSLVVQPSFLSKNVLDEQAIDAIGQQPMLPIIRDIVFDGFEDKDRTLNQLKFLQFMRDMCAETGIAMERYDQLTQGFVTRMQKKFTKN